MTASTIGREPESIYLTTPQAAELAGESPRTWEGRRVKGDGCIFYRLGSGSRPRIRYKLADVVAWIEANRCLSTTGGAA